MLKPAIFLDRDGTLIEDAGYLHDPDAVVLLPQITEALRMLMDAGFKLFLFTNQSGINRGMYDIDAVHACNTRMLELLGLGESLFEAICIAPETPSEPSVYRKPSPQFILECIDKFALNPQRSWMIGDRMSDWQAGLNADINSVALETGKPIGDAELRWMGEHGVPLHRDLFEWVATELAS